MGFFRLCLGGGEDLHHNKSNGKQVAGAATTESVDVPERFDDALGAAPEMSAPSTRNDAADARGVREEKCLTQDGQGETYASDAEGTTDAEKAKEGRSRYDEQKP